MDNKITKRRFSDFMAYEWLMVIIVSIIAIIVFELIYTVSAVRLTAGQEFKYYIDTTVYGDATAVYELFGRDETFSYDVLVIKNEQLDSQYNVLSTRLSIQEGDILITDCKEPEEDAEDKSVKLKSMIDDYYGYSYEQMLDDAKDYLLENFMADGFTEQDFTIEKFSYDNLDDSKIESVFRSRMKKDNRYRKEAQILEGIRWETIRIETLYEDVIKFEYLLSLQEEHPELFCNYTKYEQRRDAAESTDDKEYYQKLIDREISEGRENDVYALKIGALTKFATDDQKNNPSKYFTASGDDNADNVAIMVFDFRSYQPHLQYEAISFINAFVEDCSNIYDGVSARIDAAK